MKKQIVAILIALVVISSLLTVSVLSEEAYKPIIQSVTVSPTDIVDGGVVTFTVIAKSNAPIDKVCYGESILDIGAGTCVHAPCINVGDDLWKYEWTRKFSEWAPAATYIYSHIYVINEGKLRSDEWPHSISLNVTRSDHTPTPVPTPTPVTPTPPEEEGFGGYNVSLCDAIVISIGNATVIDFLNATNMTTVQVSNFKGYKGENTWRVQWSFSNRLLDVYINVTTGNVVGIEEKIAPAATPTPTPWPTPTPIATLFEKIEVNQTVEEEIEEEPIEESEENEVINLSKYPPLGSDIIKVVAIEEEIDSGGGLSLRITIESNGKTYERGVRKRDYFDDVIRKQIVELWEEDIKEIEEDAKRWP